MSAQSFPFSFHYYIFKVFCSHTQKHTRMIVTAVISFRCWPWGVRQLINVETKVMKYFSHFLSLWEWHSCYSFWQQPVDSSQVGKMWWHKKTSTLLLWRLYKGLIHENTILPQEIWHVYLLLSFLGTNPVNLFEDILRLLHFRTCVFPDYVDGGSVFELFLLQASVTCNMNHHCFLILGLCYRSCSSQQSQSLFYFSGNEKTMLLFFNN